MSWLRPIRTGCSAPWAPRRAWFPSSTSPSKAWRRATTLPDSGNAERKLPWEKWKQDQDKRRWRPHTDKNLFEITEHQEWFLKKHCRKRFWRWCTDTCKGSMQARTQAHIHFKGTSRQVCMHTSKKPKDQTWNKPKDTPAHASLSLREVPLLA